MISLAASLPNPAAPPRGAAPAAVGTGTALLFALPDQAATMATTLLAAIEPLAPIAAALPGERQADAAHGQILPDDLIARLSPSAAAPIVPDAGAMPVAPALPAPLMPRPEATVAGQPTAPASATMIPADPRFAPPRPAPPPAAILADAPALPIASPDTPATPPAGAEAAIVLAAAAVSIMPADAPAEPEPKPEPVRPAPVAAEQPAAKPVLRPVRCDAAGRPGARERAEGDRTGPANIAPATPTIPHLAIPVAAAPIDPVATTAAAVPIIDRPTTDLPPPMVPAAAPDPAIVPAPGSTSTAADPVSRTVPASAPLGRPAPMTAAAAPTADRAPISSPRSLAGAPDSAAPAAALAPAPAAPPTRAPMAEAPARDPAAPVLSSPAVSAAPRPLAPRAGIRLPAGVSLTAPAARPVPLDRAAMAEPIVPWRFAAAPTPIASPAVPAAPVIAAAMPTGVTTAATIASPLPAEVPVPVEPSRTVTSTIDTLPSAPALPPAPIPPASPAAAVFAPAIVAADEQDGRQSPAADVAALGIASPATMTATPLAADAAGQAPLDLSQPRWPQAMVDRIEALRDAADANDTRIRLVPDALGAIDIGLTRDGDTIHVRFTAEQAQTRALLQEAQPRLAEAADQRGLKLGQTSVEAAAAGQAATQQQGSPQGQQQASTPPSAGTAAQSHATGSQAQSQGQGRQPQPAVPTRPAAAPTATAAQAADDARIA